MIQKQLNTGLLILRLTFGILMLLHGIAKLSHGLEGITGMFVSKGIPGFIAYGVYLGEVIAPILLIIGFRTRIAASVLALTMIIALMVAHADDIFSLGRSGGWAVELIGLYIFGSIALFFTGGGKHAVSSSNQWD